ncbi:outer membrane beta-barrel protein [Methylocystis sp. SB2]|uniref:outer membrane protein n=1 Tax=Methylocystis sp. (strain SB2) TaxID=743836 RepID=UPI0003FE4057|nr:outer membrane beta-barrel protein [Methylocystis sp. SB2]ULO22952.1 outer membrane beta-barrel protein [Methylocystis sp. SB2]
MTRGIGIASISLLFSVAALAADLPATKAPPPPPPPVFSWQGPYLGIYAGALLGDGNFTLLSSTPLRGEAFIGGGTGGYNWQWDEHLVLGLEADFGYRGPLQVARVNFVTPSSTYGGVLGTGRVRVGYAFAPRWLAYATGGFVFGTNFTPRRFDAILPLTFGEVSTGPTVRPGWTGGVGVEYAWSDRISVKAEYLYAGLASSGVSYATTIGALPANVRSAGHVVRGGLNYHFSFGGPPAPPPPPPGPPPVVTK